MTQPTLSIITVNFNNNKGLIATLNSIKNQSFTSYEHIIIDACSTDGSKETIIKYSKETSHLAYWVSEKDSGCLLYTSDAADELDGVDLGGRSIIKKK